MKWVATWARTDSTTSSGWLKNFPFSSTIMKGYLREVSIRDRRVWVASASTSGRTFVSMADKVASARVSLMRRTAPSSLWARFSVGRSSSTRTTRSLDSLSWGLTKSRTSFGVSSALGSLAGVTCFASLSLVFKFCSGERTKTAKAIVPKMRMERMSFFMIFRFFVRGRIRSRIYL